MKQLKSRIQDKIIGAILIISTAMLLLTGASYLTYEYFAYRKTTLNKISALGKVISNNCTAAIAFDDKENAYEILSALKAEEDIIAALYDENGNLFTNYPRPAAGHEFPEKPGKPGYTYTSTHLEGFQPVMLGHKKIGTLYLKYDLKALKKQYLYFGVIAIVVFFISLLLGYFLSSELQKRISKPIIALAVFARSISVTKDYSVRATKQSDDEIGLLTDAFNQMLTQIEQQNIALYESEKNFRTLADNIPNLCWMADNHGHIFWYNKRWYEYTGIPMNQAGVPDWESIHDPAILPEVIDRWKTSIRTGEAFEMVFPLKDTDNHYRPFLTRINPVTDANGKIIRWFGTSTDITEQVKAEENLEKKNKELIKINNDLDNFIYTASHDLKSPVSNLEGLLNMVSDEREGLITEQGKGVLAMIEKSVWRLKTVIQELTEIARIQKDTDSEKELVNLNDLYNEALLSCEHEIAGYHGRIIADFSKIPQIKFSRKNLRSIFYNLISNALKYSDKNKEGLITIKSYLQGHFTVLEIKDNGLGMPEKQLEKIFGMFKRYHTHVEGSGVGLYIVKRIMENAGGSIEVESKENTGTAFTLFFKNQ